MTNDATRGVSSANYYVHLNDLLDLKHQGRPSSFEEVSKLWEQLNGWLEKTNKGTLGLPTAKTHSTFIHIGYPISQCLLRKADRQRLPDFFQWAHLDPKEEISIEELIPDLQRWTTRTTCKLSEQGKAIFTNANQDLLKAAAEIVASELRAWDGAVEDIEGHRSVKILLHLEVSSGGRKCICKLYSPAPKDFPEGSYRAETYSTDLRRLPHGEWFEITDDLVHRALQGGLTLRKDKYALKFDAASVIVLEEHSELGSWASCNRVQLGEKHLILCRTDYTDKVRSYLTQHAKSGWEQVPNPRGLPSSWNYFRNVQIITLPDNPVGELDCLYPHLHIGIHLEGGLKITRDTWFISGTPKAVVTVPAGQATKVSVDGRELAALSANIGEISLADLNLTAGEHEITVGKQHRRFQLCNDGYKPLRINTDVLAHVIQRSETDLTPVSLGTGEASLNEQQSGQLVVFGARILGLPVRETLVLAHGHKRYIVLGRRPGEILEHAPLADLPYWYLKKSGYLQGQFELTVPFEPQWLIRVGRKGKEILSPAPGIVPRFPEATIANQDKVADWIRWARKRYYNFKPHKQYHELWEQYRQLATNLNKNAR
jgi:hypothetical protein